MHDLDAIPVLSNVYTEPGAVMRFHDPASGRMEIHAHPLDVIAWRHPRDPLTRLDEAMDWIVRRAHRRLDVLARRITEPADSEEDDHG